MERDILVNLILFTAVILTYTTRPSRLRRQNDPLFSDQVKVVRLLGDSQVVAAGGTQGSIFKFELIQN